MTGLRRFAKGAPTVGQPTAGTPGAGASATGTPQISASPTDGSPADGQPADGPADWSQAGTSAGESKTGAPSTSTMAPVPEGEKCEVCGAALAPEHGHVVDVERHSLMCACRPCFLLFTHGNTAGGRYRAVPQRYLHDPDSPLTKAEWERLGIPVGSAFFLRSEATGLTGFYPSPAGATQCLLDLDAWAELSIRHPLLAAAEPDVEAILVRGSRDDSPVRGSRDGSQGGGPADTVECYLVPVDACYQLVGIVRLHWKGFDGGDARERIDEFFDGLRERARAFGTGD